ncbi:cytochrome P450 oxidoreductase [Astrocystis sublimbata]|nr:cytochrome P450 oxidoreductase [Astrocystis sublimbata]
MESTIMESTQHLATTLITSARVDRIAVVFFLIAVYLIRTRYYNGLNKIPGPFVASLTSLWKWNQVRREEMHTTSAVLHDKYGPLVRIGPNHISASSAEAVTLVHRGRNGFVKAPMYGILQPKYQGGDLHNIFSTQDPEYHAALKRTMGTLYTTTAVMPLEHFLDECTNLFLHKMDELIGSRKSAPVDMAGWLQYYTFDSLGMINFSQKLGFLEAGVDLDGICHYDHDQMLYFATWGQIASVEKIYSALKNTFTTKKENPLFHFVVKAIKDRQDNPNDAKDMLNSFLALHNAAPEKFTDRDLLAAAYINVVTAHDVVAITLRGTVYYLAKHPEVQKKLQKEIEDTEKAGKLSTPSQYTEISAMDYVMAVTNETLRYHPSTGIIFERVTPKGGVTLHGQHIPENTHIGVNAWVMNKDKNIYGEDADTFRPERWIEADTKTVTAMKMNMMTFGAGSRNCIGRNLAMMQLTKIITELYRHYDIMLAHPEREWKVSGGWLTRQSDMDMIIGKKGSLIGA